MDLTTLARPSRAVPLIALLLLAAVPVYAEVTGDSFTMTFFTRVIVYAIAATALNLALGFGGMVGFGHALFIGIGAYCVALPAHFGVDSAWIQWAIVALACGVIGWLTGAISLRTQGIGFIMITMAFSQMGYFAFVSLKQFGGDDGMAVARTSKLAGLDLGAPIPLYVASMVLLIAVLVWMARLYKAPFGMALRAARQNTRRVNALGLPATRYQLVAYVLSAILCGYAGFLLANLNAFASPGMMAWQVSGELIVMIVLGGMGTVFGPLLGALVFLGMEEFIKMFTEHWAVIFGPLIALVALMGRSGVLGLLSLLDSAASTDTPSITTEPRGALVAQGETP